MCCGTVQLPVPCVLHLSTISVRLDIRYPIISKGHPLVPTMIPSTNESDGHPSGARHGLASKLFSVMNEFGNLGEEKVVSTGDAQESSAAEASFVLSSGAKGLAATQPMHSLHAAEEETTRKEVIVARAHVEQEETQHKLGILMEDPQLWLQFKARLHASTSGSGTVGIQAALKDFLVDHPEIQEKFLREQNVGKVQKSSFGNQRRMSILEAVSMLTSELSQEASMKPSPLNSFGSNSLSTGLEAERISGLRRGSEGGHASSASSEVFGKSQSSFMSSATDLGLSFLKRAATVASTTMGDSLSSVTEASWVDVGSTNQTDNPQVISPTSSTPSGLVALTEQHDEDASGDEDGNFED